MIVKLLTEQHLEFLSLTGGCRGSSEATLVKMPHCWKSHVGANIAYVKADLHHLCFHQGSHRNSKTQFHDFSMINNVISMTILCTISNLPILAASSQR